MARSGSLGARLTALTANRSDIALAAALCAIGVLELALFGGGLTGVDVFLVFALTVPLAWRRQRALAVALFVTGALAGQAALPAEALFTRTFTGFICVFVAAYSLGRCLSGERFAVAIAACGVAVGLALGLHDASVASGLLGAAMVVGFGVGGRGVRRRVNVREILAAQARELEASADAAAKAAATGERSRIARDLEDVVSHCVCEMVVQAQAARRLMGTEAGRAAEALGRVEAQGREALGEMRRLLGVLRRDDDEESLSPCASLSQLGSLVGRMRDGGLQIALVVEGQRRALPLGVDVAAYRLIEATLRDAARRSPHGAVQIAVRHVPQALEIEIVEDGCAATSASAASAPPATTIGMAERVAAFAGQLRSTVRRDGTHEIRARLPLQSAAGSTPSVPPAADSVAAAPKATTKTLKPGSRLAHRVSQADVLLVVALTGAIAIEAATVSAREGSALANVLAAVLVAAPLLARRRFPLAAAGAGWSAVLLMTAVLTPATELTAVLASILLLSYATGAHAPARRGVAGLAIGLSGIVALNVLAASAPQSDDLVFPAVLLGLAWLVGRIVRAEQALAAEVAQRAQRIERAREQQAAVAAIEERQQMARELHDVVAHALTIMVVQGAAARRNLQRTPDRALEAITAVEQAGREALTELRRLLTLRRPTGAGAPRAPQPGLAQLQALVERTRIGGLPTELRVEGQPVSLPGGLDLAAYRVVQEALTNALRHAGPARAWVTVRFEDRRLHLKIEDDGRAAAAHEEGHGHGIAGMRERVKLYGGELRAGSRRGGGFEVTATLPLTSEPSHGPQNRRDDDAPRPAAPRAAR